MMLKISDLHAGYGGIKALKGVSLEINENEIVSVLGANGAGKSTLLKLISSVMRPESGSITMNGVPLPPLPHKVVSEAIVQVPEGRQIFPNLTVYENLMTGCFIRKDKKEIDKDLEYVYTLFPRIKERLKQYGGLLSGGEQQMLAISRGLMAKPKILLLDEPSLGLAPVIVNQIFEIIQKINKEGVSILLVEQNAYKALSISDRAYILSVGCIHKSGTREELLADTELSKAYLG